MPRKLLMALLIALFVTLSVAPGSVASARTADGAGSAPSDRVKAASKPTAKPAGKTGCARRSGTQVCFSSPPTRRNDPTVFKRVERLFDTAGRGDTIRVAMFRWDVKAPTRALIAAQRRGATVLLVGDDDLRLNKQGRRLITTLEEQDRTRRNVTICQGACLPWRAKGPFPDSQNVNHLKFYVTDIGGVRSFITSSANLERRQYAQYNSLLKIDDPGLYRFGLDYFARLQAQSLEVDGVRWSDRQKVWRSGDTTAAVYPSRDDLLLSTLRDLSCTRKARDISVMFAVIQRADVRDQLARLSRSGCRVRIVTSRDTVENWLEQPLPAGDIPDARVRTVLTHDKMLAVHAKFRGRVTHLVVTGTSNTTCGGLSYNDEVMLRIVGNRWLHGQYLAHFDDAYARAWQGRSRVMPVMKPCQVPAQAPPMRTAPSGREANKRFTIGTLNTLGHSHTKPGGNKVHLGFAQADDRLDNAMKYLNANGVSVVGLQEFEPVQRRHLIDNHSDTWGVWPRRRSTMAGAVAWRKDDWKFVSGSTFTIPYFGGRPKPMPVVKLQHRQTGARAHFISVHNPADVRGPAARWRARALEIERAMVKRLSATGAPVFLVGDFNDVDEPHCYLTPQMTSAFGPGTGSRGRGRCAAPNAVHIDQIFAAGSVVISGGRVVRSTISRRTTDHPLVTARVTLR